jgi:hypothetical protein
MRGLIFRVFLPVGNPYGILFPAAAHSGATRPQGWAVCFGEWGRTGVFARHNDIIFIFETHKTIQE